MSEVLTLADVVSRGTPVDWYEGVALAQALCDALQRTADGRASQVPELGLIQIAPEGTLSLLAAGAAGQSPVQGVGRVLLALLPEHLMPVQLRLLALTAVSPTPSYGSLRELSSALEYFERPDRSRLVREVYERCAALPPKASSEPPPLPLPTATPTLPRPAPAPPARRARTAAGVAVVVLSLGIAGAAAWWLLGNGPAAEGSSGNSLVGSVSGAAQRAAQIAGDTARAVGERLGLSAEPAPVTVEPAAPELPAPTPRVRPAGARSLAVRARPAPAVLQLPPAVVVPTPSPLIVAAAWAADLEAARKEIDLGVASGTAVYTSDDPDVTPPELVRPRLPQEPPAGVRLEDLPRVDLLISETGEVESVRLSSVSPGVGASMMLSAIKNWQFQPATLEGRPVRYARSLWLTR